MAQMPNNVIVAGLESGYMAIWALDQNSLNPI